jgi:UDP-N-acetylmuramoylalanine--D-glutamate ligase
MSQGAPSSAVIVGLGATGYSCARYLAARGVKLAVTDTRLMPPAHARLSELDPCIPVRLGRLDPALLDEAELVVTSPGVSLADPFFCAARERGIEIVGDVELFARAAAAPVAGITGTNGKSTVTTLVGRMAARAGLSVRVGGNLGEPALDLLTPAREADGRPVELYVLELSSFQLELTRSLTLKAATVLNITPDHLDRHLSIEAYTQAKARILERCETAVINLDDPLVAGLPGPAQRLTFSLRADLQADFCLCPGEASSRWLTRRGEPLMAAGQLKLKGLHNVANALAALAMGEALGLPLPAMLAELADFAGLAHRSQWVADIAGVTYINDSKGTNVGATLAAVNGLDGPLVLIAGGDGKRQDFTPLAAALRGKVRHAVLIGRDAPALAAALAGVCVLTVCGSLEEAVRVAAGAARPGDTVLLSPACASLDMFRDYCERGAVFSTAVRALSA